MGERIYPNTCFIENKRGICEVHYFWYSLKGAEEVKLPSLIEKRVSLEEQIQRLINEEVSRGDPRTELEFAKGFQIVELPLGNPLKEVEIYNTAVSLVDGETVKVDYTNPLTGIKNSVAIYKNGDRYNLTILRTVGDSPVGEKDRKLKITGEKLLESLFTLTL